MHFIPNWAFCLLVLYLSELGVSFLVGLDDSLVLIFWFLGSVLMNLLCIVGELGCGGSVPVAVGVRDR